MSNSFFYDRSAVPVGQIIDLDVQFTDAAGYSRDADFTPSVRIEDADDVVIRASSSDDVERVGLGLYRLSFEVPDGYAEGIWNDEWTGVVDGYAAIATFAFVVNSISTIATVNTTAPSPDAAIGDDPDIEYTQAEIQGINILLDGLEARLRNQSVAPDGTPCPVVPIDELARYLRLSLSEFNSYPTFTAYVFSDRLVYGMFADIIIEGAFLQALSAVAILSAGQELVVTDNGVTLTPPPVSATINTVLSSRQSLYLEKLKNAKRNIRPAPLGMGAGRIAGNSPQVLRLRHRKEGQIII